MAKMIALCMTAAILAAMLGGCGREVRTRSVDVVTLKAAGISDDELSVFRTVESETTVCLAGRKLIVLTYPPVEVNLDAEGFPPERTPHFVLIGAPQTWGFGPVTVWEGERLLLRSVHRTWWVLTDLGGSRGISLLLAYDNHGAEGPVELHMYQEPQAGEMHQRWWFCTWIPYELSHQGFALKVVGGAQDIQSGREILRLEMVRQGRLVSIGAISIDPSSGSIELKMDAVGG